MRHVVVAFMVWGGMAATPALANVEDYCAAYGRDFADQGPQDQKVWQQRYDNAQASCIFQYSQDSQAPAEKPKAKVKTANLQKAKVDTTDRKPDAKSAVKPVSGLPEQEVAAADDGRPAKGSPEWNAYCKRKYVSYDAEKGTYRSLTGVERPCIYTSKVK